MLSGGLPAIADALTARNNPVMAMAADTVIVTAENIVPVGVITPDHVARTPSIFSSPTGEPWMLNRLSRRVARELGPATVNLDRNSNPGRQLRSADLKIFFHWRTV
jgi:hypothetical protein